MHTWHPDLVSLKTIIHRKELGLLEEAADSSTGGQDEPEHLAVPGNAGKGSKTNGDIFQRTYRIPS